MGGQSLLERLVRHHVDPDKTAPPPPLVDHWRLGDSRYLVAGGVDDQPCGRWFAAGYASRVWLILEQESEATNEFPIEKRLKDADLKMLIEEIRPMRQRIVTEIASRADAHRY